MTNQSLHIRGGSLPQPFHTGTRKGRKLPEEPAKILSAYKKDFWKVDDERFNTVNFICLQLNKPDENKSDANRLFFTVLSQLKHANNARHQNARHQNARHRVFVCLLMDSNCVRVRRRVCTHTHVSLRAAGRTGGAGNSDVKQTRRRSKRKGNRDYPD